MSEIYKKEIKTTQIIDFIKCDKCKFETAFNLAIDNWCIINNENYCRKCQKKYKVGWYENSK
jgi:hypothetical protein